MSTWMRYLACLGLAVWLMAPAVQAEEEENVPLDQVPAAVKKAAEGAVAGIVLTKAEKETKGGVVVYELEGKAGAKIMEVKVSADGKVLKVEEEKEDDKNEKDDDDKDEKKK